MIDDIPIEIYPGETIKVYASIGVIPSEDSAFLSQLRSEVVTAHTEITVMHTEVSDARNDVLERSENVTEQALQVEQQALQVAEQHTEVMAVPPVLEALRDETQTLRDESLQAKTVAVSKATLATSEADRSERYATRSETAGTAAEESASSALASKNATEKLTEEVRQHVVTCGDFADQTANDAIQTSADSVSTAADRSVVENLSLEVGRTAELVEDDRIIVQTIAASITELEGDLTGQCDHVLEIAKKVEANYSATTNHRIATLGMMQEVATDRIEIEDILESITGNTDLAQAAAEQAQQSEEAAALILPQVQTLSVQVSEDAQQVATHACQIQGQYDSILEQVEIVEQLATETEGHKDETLAAKTTVESIAAAVAADQLEVEQRHGVVVRLADEVVANTELTAANTEDVASMHAEIGIKFITYARNLIKTQSVIIERTAFQ